MNILKLKWRLYALGLRFLACNRADSDFYRAMIHQNFTVQISTSGRHTIHHTYIFSQGKIFSKLGLSDHPTLKLTFINPYQANRALRHGLSHLPSLIQQMNQGQLSLQGDIGLLIWLTTLCEWARDRTTRFIPPLQMKRELGGV